MTNFFNDIKNLISKNKKEVSLKDAFDLMNKELEKATNSYDKDFFPEEEVLTVEEMHYATLNLTKDASFEDIQKKYKELKSKYEAENDIEQKARIEYSYQYFKQKYHIQ